MASAVPLSHTRPPYITMISSHIEAMTPRSCVTMMMAMPSFSCSDCISSRICAWIVTSRAVVGSSAIRISGSQANAIAIMTRCLIPPESS